MQALEEGFAAEFGQFPQDQWDELAGGFDDANLYQSWSFETARGAPRQRVVHLLLRREAAAVAAAQVRVVRLPLLGLGIAYCRWGPLWRSKGGPADPEVFRQAVRALRNEFSVRRRLALRLFPLAFKEADQAIERILLEEGFAALPAARQERTLLLDLSTTLEELRAALEQKWRNRLNKAEKFGLQLAFGETTELLEKLETIYREMTRRKNIPDVSDFGHLRRAQDSLPADRKLKIIVCFKDGQPAAGGVFSAMGDTGLYLAGATSDAGLQASGSYLVQWRFLTWLKESGFLHYDLNGINPQANPGTYTFKRGLAGKRGREVEFLGKFQVADGWRSQLVALGAERLSR